jgi:stage V sporulation protein G
VPVKITEVRISIRNEEKLKAFASITFDNCFVVRGLKVISGAQGYFVSMPSRKRRDGAYQDIAHPINNEMRQEIEDLVLDAFESELVRFNAEGGQPAMAQSNMDPNDIE